MSILVKDMKMPANCGECPMICEMVSLCRITKGGRTINERPPHCPLIEIPPHGRLIDADALKAKAIKRSGKCGGYVNVLDKVITARDIEIAPTVIPAEEGET